ncbi:VRR-NUC domain-containing protein [Geothermobacter hydrogeniphilus]|uniref:VRR-NUC domain-containing protein n=1 Tax=Geothermobacter hydrogeniphilus TaxID=1969733 RepID=A0A1X0Y852_9BACT|nr:VRR-NUC domain-containing protein [Geothermobacter hydrogeniphilus]ORJ61345.1 hypothetical protein B5V00_06850 [Geothermobacter hydrogeniphilus]
MPVLVIPRSWQSSRRSNSRPVPVRRQNRKIEAATQKAIQEWFAIQKVRCERLNSGALKTDERFVRFGFPGCPDLIVLHRAVGVGFIEVKAPGGRLSREQKEFQTFCRGQGIPHLVARSLEDAIEWWRNHDHGTSRSSLG